MVQVQVRVALGGSRADRWGNSVGVESIGGEWVVEWGYGVWKYRRVAQNERAEPKCKRIVRLDGKIEGHYRNSATRCLLPAA